MDRLIKKYQHVTAAVTSFEQAVNQYHKWATQVDPNVMQALDIDYQGIVLNLRDSTIQRFEYSIDLLWKYLKAYLDEKLKIAPEVVSPKTIIREAANARIIDENQAESLMYMVKKRNLTSHVYQEEIVEMLVKDLPDYMRIMQNVLNKLAV